ncbi:hypothetical protein BHE74_00012604 [Ensete ventricosum]|nr:hypothetical protein BHE74_00012604 [Ensete ventricosum]
MLSFRSQVKLIPEDGSKATSDGKLGRRHPDSRKCITDQQIKSFYRIRVHFSVHSQEKKKSSYNYQNDCHYIVGLDRNKIVGVSKWGTETVSSVGAAGSKGAATVALDLQAGRVSKAKGAVKAAAGRGGRKRAATVRWEEAAAAGEKKTSMRAGSRGGGGLRGEDNNAKGRGGMGQRRVAAVAGDRSRRVWPVVGCSCGRIAATENRGGAEGAVAFCDC